MSWKEIRSLFIARAIAINEKIANPLNCAPVSEAIEEEPGCH
jgi:hypothetical protein